MPRNNEDKLLSDVRQKVGGRMSMTAVIESIERDALRQAMKPEGLFEKRCQHCNRLLGKFNGQAEIKCQKCGKINRIGVK